MLRAWRLVKTRYASAAFDGEGARLYGGRWNSPGTRVAYASESIALAALEVLVHLQDSSPLPSYSLASISFPEETVESLAVASLPVHWRRSPAPSELRSIGDTWIRDAGALVLRVPSVIVQSASNFLINPEHREAGRLIVHPVEPFQLNPRLTRP